MDQPAKDIRKNNYIQYLYVGGILLIITGSLGHFFNQPFFKYIFGAGSLILIVKQLIEMFNTVSPDFRQKRLLRMNLMLTLMLALATYSMFDGTTLWIAVVLIYALVTLYMSFRN
ncbi:MAG: hypothetical protein PHD30_01030 [Paludibacter sp.]|nr:hypothetical protein [Paludibacter sp.]